MPFKVTAGYPVAVTLKVSCNIVMVAFTLTGYGCADRVPPTPVSPSPTVQDINPVPNSTVQDRTPAGELWKLTTTIVSLEGSACFWTQPVGAKFDGWTLLSSAAGRRCASSMTFRIRRTTCYLWAL